MAPNIQILDINGLSSLTEAILTIMVKEMQSLQVITMNFTENISDNFLNELRKTYPDINFIRTVIKYSDPSDTGLRMKFPMVRKAKKVKKSKKKK